MNCTLYERYVKRPLDVIGALVGITIGGPLMLLIAVAVRVTMGSPVLFRQVRPGRHERLFTLVKFRSMKEAQADADGRVASDVQRLTRVGVFIRKTSLDELPQMVNVLRGEMSFIGPRPLAVQYLEYYSPIERMRHRVRPGITGLAQVHGRNSLSWEERFAYDLRYVTAGSARMDLEILLLTVRSVLRRSNVQVRGTGVVQDFDKYRLAQWGQESVDQSPIECEIDSQEVG